MAKKVKLADIAQQLEVSTVTVSKALSGKKGVSEELREKIKNLAEEMGYRHPSGFGLGLDKKNIGIVVSEKYLEKYSSFYWELYQNVVTQAAKRSSDCILEVLTWEDEKKGRLPKLVRDHKIQGLIVAGTVSFPYLEALREKTRLPLLLLDFYVGSREYDCVISNSYYGMYQLTNYLFEKGHNEIGFVGTLLSTSSITDRYYGYSRSLLEHGVKCRPEWMIKDRALNGTLLNKLELPRKLPTAFACNCDKIAYELIQQLEARGIQVPGDISVVGFDNYLNWDKTKIGITTYEVNMKEMARTSVRTMLKKMEAPSLRTGIQVVEGRIVVKDSVRRT